ncbi:hypothetical protein SUDANB95_04812 [Actinosynnema sp. ALI-1.44]
MCYTDRRSLAHGAGGPFTAVLEALRNVVVTMVRSGPHATFPDTDAGWAGVSAALVRHLGLGRGDVVRTRELVPAPALRRPPGAGGAFGLAPDAIVDRRRIVFAGGQVIPVRGSGDARLDGARIADHTFPWTVLAVEESFVVICDEEEGVLRVLVNVRELVGALVLLHDALWLLLGREAQLEADSQLPPPHLRPVLETLAEGATDLAAQRALALSSRTFSRRASELLTTLGARSRFQAGVEAARRRWV